MSAPSSNRGKKTRSGASRVQGGGWSAGGSAQPRRVVRPPKPASGPEDEAPASTPDERVSYVPEPQRRSDAPGGISQDNVKVLCDGIVLLRQAFGAEEQQRWVDMCIDHGTGQVEGVHSFYDGEISRNLGYIDPSVQSSPSSATPPAPSTTGPKKLNLVNKARINVPIALHPPQFTASAQELVRIAHEWCGSIPLLDQPNTCRINHYTNSGKIGWHYDRVPALTKEQQAEVTDPVISMSFGNSAEFRFKHKMDDPEETIILASGDVVIFGGPSRMIYHTVPKIIKQTCPKGLDLRQFNPGRFNVSYYYN